MIVCDICGKECKEYRTYEDLYEDGIIVCKECDKNINVEKD